MMGYKITVTYFKPSGKYYSTGEYITQKSHMYEVFDEFRAMLQRGERPGLVDGHSGFTAILNCDEHPMGYPAMFTGEA